MSNKLKKYTHKEINEAAMGARNEAALIHTLESVRENNPINKTMKKEADLGIINYNRYAEYEIDNLIHFLQTEKEIGATHIEFEFYDDDSSLLLKTYRMSGETPQVWMDRVISSRDRLLDQVYGQKQREMMAYNEKIDTYIRLKRELGEE